VDLGGSTGLIEGEIKTGHLVQQTIAVNRTTATAVVGEKRSDVLVREKQSEMWSGKAAIRCVEWEGSVQTSWVR